MSAHQILVVDDDPLVLQLLGRTLRSEGYDVTLAASGAEAFLEVDQRAFDLVLTDLMMDPINGLAVLRKVKESRRDTVVVIITGHADLGVAIDALRLDADDFMLKPFEPDELVFRVSRSLQKLSDSRRLRAYENLLPVCCVCGAIRDDEGRPPGSGEWVPLERYIEHKVGYAVTSSYCPHCAEDLKDRAALDS